MGIPSPASALAERPSASDEGELYYIYASSAGKSPGENIKVLESGSATDELIASLNEQQVIILSEAPNPAAPFDVSDDTTKWFQSLDPGASVSLTLDNPPDGDIVNFAIELTKPWPLTFSSASDVLLFTFGPSEGVVGGPTGAKIPPPGIDAAGQTLTCGLDFTNSQDITGIKVKDLFTLAGKDGLIGSLPDWMPDLAAELKKPGKDEIPKRNALWFTPSSNDQVDLRLQFQMPNVEAFKNLLNETLPGFTLEAADIVYKNQTRVGTTEEGQQTLEKGTVFFNVICSVKGEASSAPKVPIAVGIEFFLSDINITCMLTTRDGLSGVLIWLSSLLQDPELEGLVNNLLNKEENGKKILSNVILRRLTISLSTADDPKKPKLSSLSFDVEVSTELGKGTKGSVVFLVSYEWSASTGGLGTLSGELWNDYDKTTDLDLQASQEIWTIFQPLTNSPADAIQIATLIPGQEIVNIPTTLPSEITRAYVALSKDTFTIGGVVTAIPVTPGSLPQPYLGDVSVDASFSWGQSKAFTLDVAFHAGIEPSTTSEITAPALLSGSISYDSSQQKWALKASLSGLYASTLAEFFDEDAKDHVGPLIKSIAIDTLDVEYTYEGVTEGADKGKSKGSEFKITGDLFIATLKLSLDFNYNKDGFTFMASLNPQKKDATIGQVLSSVLNSNEIELPPFVSKMILVGDNKDAFKLDIAKKTTKSKEEETTSFLFLAQLNIGKLHVDFAQLHSSAWGVTVPSKRLVKVAIDGFPKMKLPEIPLVGVIEQPIDELYFLWVQDPPQTGQPQPGKQGGITREDLVQLNSGLQDQILVKDKIKPEEQKTTDLLVAVGCHFAVIIHSPTGERSCLLDYDFMKPKASGTKARMPSTHALAIRGSNNEKSDDDQEDDTGPAAQAPFKKKTGPISISNIGLKYKNKKLIMMFDATFELGPIGFTLIGFSIDAEFETLDKLPDITTNIQGLSAAFEKPPLTIAGIIRHANEGGMDYYAGGMIVGWVPYQFEAAGFYGKVTPKSGHEFRSVFVFAKLNGPLITLEFAEITGICGGFGYNSSVRLPTADQIYEFPFIANSDLGGANDALQVLQKLVDPGPSGWFSPLDNTYWAAVGMKIDAFQMISLNAVVVVQFGNAIKLGIFALALADIPTAKSPIKFAHVELGISAVADFDYGTLKIEAQLSPRSFIFSKDCHLTGGAALYYWFDAPNADKSLVGDFVFTIGGYHQAFLVPTGYPNPPRLGFNWSLGGSLSISGEAYFAITPKACMGGGRLHASFKAGPIEAWFDAFADFLINYKPFHFYASAGLSVGVRFNIDILFIHTHISVEIGAQLYLWGPPLAGRVHVDFWIVGFDINFGSDKKSVDPVDLTQFYELVLQAASSSSVASTATALLTASAEPETEGTPRLTGSRPKNEGHNFLAQSGLMNPEDKPEKQQNETWIVRSGTFSFIVACKMAINQVKTDPNSDPIITYGDKDQGIDVFAKPMQLTEPMVSTVVVQIGQEHSDGSIQPDEGWKYEKHLKSVPRGLWAKYNPKDDPGSSNNNNIKDLLNSDDGALPLMMGVQITAPKAQMSPDPFPAYITADASLQNLPSERAFPTIADASEDWAPVERLSDTKDQYDAIYQGWTVPTSGTGDEGQQGFVETLASSLAWDNVAGLKEIAGIPERLKKGFKNLYVAAPLITA